MNKRKIGSMMTVACMLATVACSTTQTGLPGDTGEAGAPGTTALVTQTVVGSGNANCPAGGTEIQAGLDVNNDGVLELSEVSSTTFVCNGVNGVNGSNGVGLQGPAGPMGLPGDPGQAGPQGPAGPMGAPGQAGANGLNSLVLLSSLSVGDPICPNGGTEIRSGLDLNGDGVLEANEVQQGIYVCNGSNGTNGINAVVYTTPVAPSEEGPCPYGGTAINTNYSSQVSYVCNGRPGQVGSPGIPGSPGSPGPQGDAGPQGVSGPAGAASIIVQIPVAPDCLNGGVTIETGLDANNDGVLDEGDLNISVSEICDGAPGQQGIPGTPGTNGTNATIQTAVEPAGTNCQYGGSSFTACDPVCDPTTTVFACNGSPGTDGTNGTNGTNAVLQQAAATTDQCPYGGTVYTPCTTDSNNVVVGECGASSVICNGSPGEAGAVGAQGDAGANGSSATITTAPDTTDCANGGTQFTITNTDSAGNITTNTTFVCSGLNGADGGVGPQGPAGEAGPPGPVGEAGVNGTSAYIKTTSLAVGNANCQYGGSEFQACITGGSCGTPTFACTGAPGSNGCSTVTTLATINNVTYSLCGHGNGNNASEVQSGCQSDGGSIITSVKFVCNNNN